QERRSEAQADEGTGAVLQKDSPRNHDYLRWNSGAPSVSAAICGTLPAFWMVSRVAPDASSPRIFSLSRERAICGSLGSASMPRNVLVSRDVPGILLLARARAKFMRFTSDPVFTHASAVSL